MVSSVVADVVALVITPVVWVKFAETFVTEIVMMVLAGIIVEPILVETDVALLLVFTIFSFQCLYYNCGGIEGIDYTPRRIL